MKIKIKLFSGEKIAKKLVVEPWGEEFDFNGQEVEILLESKSKFDALEIEINFSEDGFLYFENPRGFRPAVLLNGIEDERPAFALAY
jgi:hypothetical protein